MTRRLPRKVLRRTAKRTVGHLPGSALRPPGLARQALIGLGAGVACAGGLACTDLVTGRAANWREGAGRVLIVVPDRTRLPAVLALAGPGAREVDTASLAGTIALGDAPAMVTTDRHDPELADRLQQAAPGSLIEADGGAPAARLAAFGTRLSRLCAGLLAAIAVLSLSSLAVAARAAAARVAPSARLLADLGLTPGALRLRLAVPLATMAGLGCALGIAAIVLPFGPIDPVIFAAALAAAAVTLVAASAALRRCA